MNICYKQYMKNEARLLRLKTASMHAKSTLEHAKFALNLTLHVDLCRLLKGFPFYIVDSNCADRAK